MKYWEGKLIDVLESNQVFVFGSNPEGRHGMGAAKSAMKFGARYGKGRGLYGNTYALVTKNLKAGFVEHIGGHTITYKKAGAKSVSLEQIEDNIKELFDCARIHHNMDFIIAYHNGAKTLSGYSPLKIIQLMVAIGMPDNVLIHGSFKPTMNNPKFKVVIAGGRDFIDYGFLKVKVKSMLRKKMETHDIVVVCGEAKGADALGKKLAKEMGWEVESHVPDWKDLSADGAVVRENKYGKYNATAGMSRSECMAKAGDAVIVFWDGSSTGTQGMINLAKQYNLPYKVFGY